MVVRIGCARHLLMRAGVWLGRDRRASGVQSSGQPVCRLASLPQCVIDTNEYRLVRVRDRLDGDGFVIPTANVERLKPVGYERIATGVVAHRVIAVMDSYSTEG